MDQVEAVQASVRHAHRRLRLACSVEAVFGTMFGLDKLQIKPHCNGAGVRPQSHCQKDS